MGGGIAKLMKNEVEQSYNPKSAAANGIALCSVCHKASSIEHEYCPTLSR